MSVHSVMLGRQRSCNGHSNPWPWHVTLHKNETQYAAAKTTADTLSIGIRIGIK